MTGNAPKNFNITSVEEFIHLISGLGVISWFRGEAKDYGQTSLTPNVWRPGQPGYKLAAQDQQSDEVPIITDIEIGEIRRLQQAWAQGNVPDPDFEARWPRRPWHSSWIRRSMRDHVDWLFLAQHQDGFVTRLLDVTADPLIALYFAVCDHPDDDGIVWLGSHNFNRYEPQDYADRTIANVFDVFTARDGATPGPDTAFLMSPLATNTRMVAQFGMFLWTRGRDRVGTSPMPVHINKDAKGEVKAVIERWAPNPHRHLCLPKRVSAG